MNDAVGQMLSRYTCRTTDDYEHALREILQELALLGLWRGKFFEHAAFYGETALRILHGLDRFSEDMGFSLLTQDSSFDFMHYATFIEKELSAWGFTATMEYRKKKKQTAIESAFLKANTAEQLLMVKTPERIARQIPVQRLLRIKIEVDICPPMDFQTEMQYILQPIPFAVRAYSLDCLQAGKLHALLFRSWKNRVKGRDWYDWVWYCARKIPVNLRHLQERMVQSGHWTADRVLTHDDLTALLKDKIERLDIESAKIDADRFTKNADALNGWSKDLFLHLAETMSVT
ncbi:MAG: nucleotidyl transferase AbiEii/AbiGii toxin family protein [Spartobacteria bacterium]|nr:nucleotidyl transferase AbiEii/AbiGii toxin family protein [Spartobacteria bacterium]